MLKRKLFALIALCVTFSLNVLAQSLPAAPSSNSSALAGDNVAPPVIHEPASPPSIDVSISSPEIQMDQTETIEIRVEWKRSEAEYSFALPEFRLGNMSLIRQGEGQETFTRDGQEWTRKTFNLELQPEKPGTGTIGEAELPYIDPTRQLGGKLKIPQQMIRITKKPVPLARYLLYAAIPLGPIIVFAYFMSALRRRNLKEASEQPLPLNPTDELKSKIENLSFYQDQKAALFTTASEFRRFLISTYQLSSATLTDDDLLAKVSERNIAREEINTLRSLLTQLKEAKYTGGGFSETEFNRLRKEIVRFIESKKVVGTP